MRCFGLTDHELVVMGANVLVVMLLVETKAFVVFVSS